MNVNDVFPSKYIKSSDLGGATPTVTISRVSIEEVGQSKDRRPIIYFEGKEKGCVINKTNAKAVTKIAGSAEMDEWIGTRVQLFVTTVEFQGDQVDAIRIRAPKIVPKPAPAPVAAVKPAKPGAKPAPKPAEDEPEAGPEPEMGPEVDVYPGDDTDGIPF